MSSVYAPSLSYPNGGESLATPTVSVRWEEPQVKDSAGRPVWYELYYTDDYRPDSEPNWLAIATVPSGTAEFVWRVAKNVISDRVRIGIRARNSQGTRSAMSVSAANFSLNRSVLPVPRIISPVSGGRYDSTVQIVVEADRLPDRSYYQFYYSSASAGIPMTSINQKVLARDIPLAWLTVQLPAANDYQLYASVVAPDGRTSEIVSVDGLTISHEGFFIIDTLPPQASIRIDGDSLFTRERDISVSVFAYDAATDIQALQLKDAEGGTPQKGKTRTSYVLTGEDGIKQVKALVQDFGSNRNLDSGVSPIMVNAAPIVGASLADFHVSTFSGVIYVRMVTTGTENALYEFTITPEQVGYRRRITVFADRPTAVASFVGEEYIGTVDAAGVGHLKKYLTTGLTEVTTLGDGIYITDMEEFGGFLYYGTNDGHVYRYNGTDTVAVAEGTDSVNIDGDLGAGKWGRPAVRRLKVEGSKLFIMYENTPVVGILTGDYLLYR